MSRQPSVTFVVQEAGCEHCAALVRTALEPLLRVRDIVIDEAGDSATVRGEIDAPVSQAEIDAALAEVSTGSAHRYRLAPGSWREG